MKSKDKEGRPTAADLRRLDLAEDQVQIMDANLAARAARNSQIVLKGVRKLAGVEGESPELTPEALEALDRKDGGDIPDAIKLQLRSDREQDEDQVQALVGNHLGDRSILTSTSSPATAINWITTASSPDTAVFYATCTQDEANVLNMVRTVDPTGGQEVTEAITPSREYHGTMGKLVRFESQGRSVARGLSLAATAAKNNEHKSTLRDILRGRREEASSPELQIAA